MPARSRRSSFSDIRLFRSAAVSLVAAGWMFIAAGAGGCSSSSSKNPPPDAGNSDASASSPDVAPDNAPPAPSCADGGAPTAAYSDDFSAGLADGVWTVTQTTDGLFAADATQGDLRLSKVGTNTSTALQSITVTFNLAAHGGPADGDFALSLDLRDAMLGPSGLDQLEFHANFADNSEFFDVYEHSGSSFNLHVWTGKVVGQMPTDVTGGTFRIVRTGSTITGSLDDTMLYTTTNSAALSAIHILMQMQLKSDDPISVSLDNFHYQAGCLP
jgi:hypothetical protein